MNKRSKLVQWLMATALATLSAGCVKEAVVPFDKFHDMSTKAKQQYAEKSEAEIASKKLYDEIQNERLLAGLPVYFYVDKLKLTKLWDKQARTLSFFNGFQTDPVGSKALTLLVVLTDEESPMPVVNTNPDTGEQRPAVISSNVSVQDTFLRAGLLTVLGWGGPAFNSVIAARINRCDGDNCGGPTSIAVSGSDSAAVQNSNTNVGICADGCID